MTTDQTIGTSKAARVLRDHMRDSGIPAMTREEAAEYLEELGLPPDRHPLALGYGSARARHFWRVADDNVVLLNSASRRPASDDQADQVRPNEQEHHLVGQQQVLRDICSRMGIPSRIAAVVGHYSASFDLDDPNDLWEMLADLPELNPSQRRRIFRSYLHQAGLEVPQELLQQVNARSEAHSTNLPPAKRTYFVSSAGDLIPLPVGEDGLSFGEALAQQHLALERTKLASVGQEPAPQNILNQARGLWDLLPEQLQGRLTEAMFRGSAQPVNVGGTTFQVSSADEYLKIRQADTQEKTMDWVKQSFPGFLQTVRDIASAAVQVANPQETTTDPKAAQPEEAAQPDEALEMV